MKSKIAQLLERYDYAQEAKPSEYNIRARHSQQYALPVTVVNGIWECRDDEKVQRGTCPRRKRGPLLTKEGHPL
jgi:hypothetical protein